MRTFRVVALILFLAGIALAQKQEAVSHKVFFEGIVAGGLDRPNQFVLPGDQIIPQIAAGGGTFTTLFFITNITDQSAQFQIDFYDDNGARLSVPFPSIFGQTHGSFIGLRNTIPAHGVSLFVTDIAGVFQQGYARLQSVPQNSISVSTSFSQIIPGRPSFLAAVPLTNVLQSRFAVPYFNVPGNTTTLAIVNPNQAAQQVTMFARAANGTVTCQTSFIMAGFQHQSFIVRDRLPCTGASSTLYGALDIQGQNGLSAVGFVFDDSGAFYTLIPYGPPPPGVTF